MENATTKAVLVCTLALTGLMATTQATAQTTETLTATFTLSSYRPGGAQRTDASPSTTPLTTNASWVNTEPDLMFYQHQGIPHIVMFKLRDTSIKSADCTGTFPDGTAFTSLKGQNAPKLPQILIEIGRDGVSGYRPFTVTCNVSR